MLVVDFSWNISADGGYQDSISKLFKTLDGAQDYILKQSQEIFRYLAERSKSKDLSIENEWNIKVNYRLGYVDVDSDHGPEYFRIRLHTVPVDCPAVLTSEDFRGIPND